MSSPHSILAIERSGLGQRQGDRGALRPGRGKGSRRGHQPRRGVRDQAQVIEIDLPDGVRVRVDSGVNEKALRRVLSAVRGLG
jgi:hypothetical protein